MRSNGRGGHVSEQTGEKMFVITNIFSLIFAVADVSAFLCKRVDVSSGKFAHLPVTTGSPSQSVVYSGDSLSLFICQV